MGVMGVIRVITGQYGKTFCFHDCDVSLGYATTFTVIPSGVKSAPVYCCHLSSFAFSSKSLYTKPTLVFIRYPVRVP